MLRELAPEHKEISAIMPRDNPAYPRRGRDDLTVWDGDPLDARTHVVKTFIDGAEVYSR